jgi:hypothetical protein
MTRFHTSRVVRIAAMAVAAALPVTAAVATSAAAATATWTVSPGGSFTGPLSSGATFVIQDGVTGTTVTCVSSAIAGTFTAGSAPSGDLGTVTSVSPGTCTGPGGSTYTVATNASSADPWVAGAVSYNASEGITSGDLTSSSASTGVAITLTGPGCTVVLGGTTTVRAYLIFDYQNSNGLLATPRSTYRPTIRVLSSTCSSWLVTDGMRVYTTPVFPPLPITGGFALNPLQTITGP